MFFHIIQYLDNKPKFQEKILVHYEFHTFILKDGYRLKNKKKLVQKFIPNFHQNLIHVIVKNTY